MLQLGRAVYLSYPYSQSCQERLYVHFVCANNTIWMMNFQYKLEISTIENNLQLMRPREKYLYITWCSMQKTALTILKFNLKQSSLPFVMAYSFLIWWLSGHKCLVREIHQKICSPVIIDFLTVWSISGIFCPLIWLQNYSQQ